MSKQRKKMDSQAAWNLWQANAIDYKTYAQFVLEDETLPELYRDVYADRASQIHWDAITRRFEKAVFDFTGVICNQWTNRDHLQAFENRFRGRYPTTQALYDLIVYNIEAVNEWLLDYLISEGF